MFHTNLYVLCVQLFHVFLSVYRSHSAWYIYIQMSYYMFITNDCVCICPGFAIDYIQPSREAMILQLEKERREKRKLGQIKSRSRFIWFSSFLYYTPVIDGTYYGMAWIVRPSVRPCVCPLPLLIHYVAILAFIP
jgi:hypothetical protein